MRIAHEIFYVAAAVQQSPQLPKRQARMALRALNLSSATLKEDFEDAMRREAFKLEQNNKVRVYFDGKR